MAENKHFYKKRHQKATHFSKSDTPTNTVWWRKKGMFRKSDTSPLSCLRFVRHEFMLFEIMLNIRLFLSNPIIPMDNNAVERAIRPFCIGKKNWLFMDTLKGVETSAIIYSIVETAKANNLRLYDYLKYILEKLPNYVDGSKSEIPPKLLPWSEELPTELRKSIA